MTAIFLAVLVFLSVAMAGAWALQRRTGNGGWADAVWSFALGAGGVALALLPGPPTPRQWVVAALVAVWSVRLGWHIAQRTVGAHEDARYADLRAQWGTNFQWRMFLFLQIQAAAAAFLALSMTLAAHNPAPFPRVLDGLGIAILAAAIAGEAVADAQLRRFKNDAGNKGRVCDIGLWGWSRHPNYFFEWLGWVAYPCLAIGDWTWGWLALSGPVFMYYLLAHVSGVPLLEKTMLRSRGDAFRAYQDRVSAFFPLPPSKGDSR